MKQGILFLVIIFFWFLPPAQAEIKTFVHTVKQPFSGSQSPDDARTAAVHKAKREVLEKAGSYLETLTIVEDGRLTKDQVLALAGGILNTEVISQKPYTTGEGYGVTVKVRVRVDSSVLEDRVKELISDKTAMSQLTIIREREKKLLNEIERLEEVNQELANKKETQTIKKEKKGLQRDFQHTTKGLDASSLIIQVMELKKGNEFTNPRKALELLDKIIGLDPDFALAYNNRGVIYNDFKQYYRAIQDLDKAIKLDPGLAMAYYNRSLPYLYLKQYHRAIQDLDRAVELDPDYAPAYNNRGLLYITIKSLYQGCADMNKACELGECEGLGNVKSKGYCN